MGTIMININKYFQRTQVMVVQKINMVTTAISPLEQKMVNDKKAIGRVTEV